MHGSFIPRKFSILSSDGEGLFGETFGGSLVGVSDSGEGCTVLGDGRVHGKAAANASCCGEGGGKAAANASCGEGGGGGTGCRAGEEISLVGSVSVTSVPSFSFVEKVIRAACCVASDMASTVVPIRDWKDDDMASEKRMIFRSVSMFIRISICFKWLIIASVLFVILSLTLSISKKIWYMCSFKISCSTLRCSNR